jgi:hypothetical protein
MLSFCSIVWSIEINLLKGFVSLPSSLDNHFNMEYIDLKNLVYFQNESKQNFVY